MTTARPWTIKVRTDGLVNIYAGASAVALCLKREDADLIIASVESADEYDPTPWCNGCGARTRSGCDCGPLARND